MRSSSPESARVTVSLPRRRPVAALARGRRLDSGLAPFLALTASSSSSRLRRAARARHGGRHLWLVLAFFLFQAARGFEFGAAARFELGGFARLFLGLAFFGGVVLALKAIFFDGAAARFLYRRACGLRFRLLVHRPARGCGGLFRPR